jgi:acyl carrier protein
MQSAHDSDDDFAIRVIGIIASQDAKIDEQNVTSETTLKDLLFDSFGAVTLMFDLEEEFGVEITDDDARDLKTVGDVIARLRKLCGVLPVAS